MTAPTPIGRLSEQERHQLADAWPDFWQTHAAVERIVRAHAERAWNEALTEVAREFQMGGWMILAEPVPASANRVIALGQRVTDWLRDRAEESREVMGIVHTYAAEVAARSEVE